MVLTVMLAAVWMFPLLPPEHPMLPASLEMTALSRGSAPRSGEVRPAGLPLLLRPEQDDYGKRTAPPRDNGQSTHDMNTARPP